MIKISVQKLSIDVKFYIIRFLSIDPDPDPDSDPDIYSDSDYYAY